MRTPWLCVGLLAAAGAAFANDPPEVDHQPTPCTLSDKPIALCATITDDSQVAKARLYFRRAGEDFYYAVDMVFGGINYCGTLPAPREDKARTIEYYIQAWDEQYESKRTSTYQMNVQSEAACAFPPLQRDAEKAAAISVFATDKKQKKLDDAFTATGVRFVPVGGK